MFEDMTDRIREETVMLMMRVNIEKAPTREESKVEIVSMSAGGQTERVAKKPDVAEKKPGRNEPCPCGSGKKYKNCCGRN